MANRYVSDTVGLIHAFPDVFRQPSKLSARVQDLYRDAFLPCDSGVRLSIPAVVFVEIHEKWCKKEELSRRFYYEVFMPAVESPNIEVRSIDEEVLESLQLIRGSLEDHEIHDKLILASAVVLGCPLITCDSAIVKFNNEHQLIDIIF